MFGQSKPVVFDRYASRRSRRLLPNWLWLLLFGAAIGAGTLFYVQQHHLPPRLSAAESIRLRSAFDAAAHERARLATELAQANKKLADALAGHERAAGQLAATQRDLQAQRKDIEDLLAALPPDPRGGAIEIRAARFAATGDTLDYHIVLARTKAQGAPLAGVLQLVVAGKAAGGRETTVALEPVDVSIGRYEIANGSLPMPIGFVPRQATIRVLDRPGGKPVGMRVIRVQ